MESLDELLAAQLAALGIELQADIRQRLLRFQQELLQWNRRFNLTAIRDPRASLERNLVDSLTLLPLLGEGSRLLDLGSGAGLPGLAVRIARPDIALTSVEAQEKKVLFQRHVVRLLDLAGSRILHGRIEALAQRDELRQSFDVVTARALTSTPRLLRLAQPFLAPEAKLIVMKGPEEDEVEADEPSTQGLHRIVEHCLNLPSSQARRRLLVYASRHD